MLVFSLAKYDMWLSAHLLGFAALLARSRPISIICSLFALPCSSAAPLVLQLAPLMLPRYSLYSSFTPFTEQK